MGKAKKRERAVGHRIGSICPVKLTSSLRRSSCIDKIVLAVPGVAPIAKLKKVPGMLWKPIGKIRRFPIGYKFLTPDGIAITVHIRRYGAGESQVEFNPNQLGGWAELESIAEILTGLPCEQIKIHEIHYNVDLRVNPEIIRGRINPRHFKKIAFYKVMETWVSGKHRELRVWSGHHSTYFGNRASKQVFVYDRSKKQNLKTPQTRIEVRLKGKARLGGFNLCSLREHLKGDMNPFYGLQFYKLGNTKFTSGLQFMKYDHISRLIEEFGLKWTRSFVVAHYAKPKRESAYGFLWKPVKPVTYPTYKQWRKNMDGYLLRKPRKDFLKIWGIK